ncbi:PREDICTED: protein FAR1-RELATED SEQUENCE 9 [Camelina sativa]|uniref:Protein FAR1-RELATED SEQUENCE n=1 Tax=Camelina sativa TaxID=90675 RepID=A0ABM0Y799_CAMSA|nr:PREDICTED: protein FAR1-RELATED SEQUENCE 9 [Camelina sativa]
MSERTLGSGVEHVLNYLKRRQLENPGFLYAMEDDCGNVFWADPTCRLNYTYFGDTVVFDTMYRRGKRYQVPFAAFTGFNHHGQPLLFGCALILNESESSFAWLFHTWLQAMSAPPPPSITVEPDRLIQVAVSQVFCQTRLRFSQPLIFKETEEKLAHLYQSHPSFESEFINCVTETETAAEFEASWDIIVRRYYLQDNDWLQSIYNARQQWVRVFIRDAFYGVLSTNEGSSSLNSFFQGFVDASTTMQTLIQQHDKAIDSWREKELKADYEAIHSTPVMKTPSPMEKQAASLANNVSTLPSRYLLRRWTKSAKTRGSEEQPEFSNSCQESLTVCYNNLRQEATKYVEEGAKSIQIYKVAMDALDEAAKKVVAASNKFRGATPGTTLPNGDPYPSEEARETTSAMNLPGGEKERTILELTTELERTGQRCEVYRANLLSILRDMEEQKFQLSLKVQNARLSLKE